MNLNERRNICRLNAAKAKFLSECGCKKRAANTSPSGWLRSVLYFVSRFVVTYRWMFTRRHENCGENYGAGRDHRCRGQVMSWKRVEIYAPVTIEIHFHNYLTTVQITAAENSRPDFSPRHTASRETITVLPISISTSILINFTSLIKLDPCIIEKNYKIKRSGKQFSLVCILIQNNILMKNVLAIHNTS
jgi:hypothetical protein